MCDWGGGPYGMAGYKPPEVKDDRTELGRNVTRMKQPPSRDHHESDREFAQRTEVPVSTESHVPFPGQQPVQQGWQCPVCGTVNAPFMPVCGNNANHGKTITTTHT